VIGETCEIGSHVKLYQGVTLGLLLPDRRRGQPRARMSAPSTIEDRVVIHANATVLGGTTRMGITRSSAATCGHPLDQPRRSCSRSRSSACAAKLRAQNDYQIQREARRRPSRLAPAPLARRLSEYGSPIPGGRVDPRSIQRGRHFVAGRTKARAASRAASSAAMASSPGGLFRLQLRQGLAGRGGIEFLGVDGPLRDHGHGIVPHLHEAAFNEHLPGGSAGPPCSPTMRTAADPQPPDERGVAAGHAPLAVEERQRDESRRVSRIVVSGVTIRQRTPASVFASAMGGVVPGARRRGGSGLGGHLLGLLFSLLDRADIHEGLLGEMIPLAVGDLLERADRVGEVVISPGLPVNTSATKKGCERNRSMLAGPMHRRACLLRTVRRRRGWR